MWNLAVILLLLKCVESFRNPMEHRFHLLLNTVDSPNSINNNALESKQLRDNFKTNATNQKNIFSLTDLIGTNENEHNPHDFSMCMITNTGQTAYNPVSGTKYLVTYHIHSTLVISSLATLHFTFFYII